MIEYTEKSVYSIDILELKITIKENTKWKMKTNLNY